MEFEKLINENVPVLLSYVDSSQTYQYMNREYEVWFHQSRSDIIGHTLREVLGQQAYDMIKDRVHKALSGHKVKFEQELKYKGAGTRWVEATYIPHFIKDGSVAGFFAVVQDISARKKIERDANASADLLYRTITDSIPGIFIWVTDAEGNVVYVNQYWIDQTGLDVDNLSGEVWLSVVHPDDRSTLSQAWTESLRFGSSYSARARFRTHNNYRTFEIKGEPIRDSNAKILYWVGTCVDIELDAQEKFYLLREKKEAEESNRAKSAFLAHMSHEIRTPLSAIAGYAELLAGQSHLNSETQEIVETILRNTNHLGSLVNDILDLSRIESGHDIDVSITTFSLNEVLSFLTGMFRLQSERKGIKLAFIQETTLPNFIESDEKLLRQILINLVGNAVKFTEKGRVELSAAFDNHRSVLTFRVSDSGVGIPKEDQKKIFEAFGQSKSASKRHLKGSGLGLTLSKLMAQRLGGDLLLEESTVGSGSCFVVDIPIGIPKAYIESKDRPASTPNEKSLTNIKLLLVEDSDDIRYLMETVLTSLGASVISVACGNDGVDQANELEFDIVLMDIQLPDIDGHEALRRIRKAKPAVPIVALTADATREEAEKCRRSGFTAYQTKPVPIARIGDLILHWIQLGSKK